MTRNTITIELTCNGKTLRMGPNEARREPAADLVPELCRRRVDAQGVLSRIQKARSQVSDLVLQPVPSSLGRSGRTWSTR